MVRQSSHGGARAPSQRQLRVGEELRHVIVGVLGRDLIRDPDVAGVAITITEVRVSPDLKNATAFVVPLGGEDTDQLVVGLNRAKAYIRREVARLVKLRHAPDLSFVRDTSFDEAGRIDALLKRVIPDTCERG